MVDNLKSAVLAHAVGQAPVFNPRYKDFADHYGFAITACGVGEPQEKGRVENAVGYVKKNFLAGLELGRLRRRSTLPPGQWLDDRGQRPRPRHHQATAGGAVPGRTSRPPAAAGIAPTMRGSSRRRGPTASSA